MRWMLTAAAAAAFTMSLGGVAAASVCGSACDHNYGLCNGLNGANAQSVCMPKWMQCKKACTAPVKAPTKVVNITPTPKR